MAADVEPIRYSDVPEALTLPLNCTNTESLVHESFWALPRIHR